MFQSSSLVVDERRTQDVSRRRRKINVSIHPSLSGDEGSGYETRRKPSVIVSIHIPHCGGMKAFFYMYSRSAIREEFNDIGFAYKPQSIAEQRQCALDTKSFARLKPGIVYVFVRGLSAQRE